MKVKTHNLYSAHHLLKELPFISSTWDSNHSRSGEVKYLVKNIQFIMDKAGTQSHLIINDNLKWLFT